MNIKSIIIAAVALTMGLSACNKEEDLIQQYGVPAKAVHITASVGSPFAATRSNPLGTVEEQAKFNDGDKMLVRKNGDPITYQFNGIEWMPVDSKFFLWKRENESLYANYPVDENDSYISDIQLDQSSLEKLALSDLMFGKTINAPKGETVNFVMQRLTSRVIVKIAGFNSEFPTDTKVTDVKIAVAYYFDDNPDIKYCSPYQQGGDGVGSTYTLLVGSSWGPWRRVHLKVSDKEMHTDVFPNMDFGKSYTYNLTVGKEKLEIENVTVEDWNNEEIIPDGQAGEME